MADSVRTKSLPGVGYVGDPAKHNGLAIITLRGSDGYDRCLWFDTTGDLRTADVDTVEADAFNPDSSGSVVGGQS
jgi:uncharacterized protein YodC (DUF2158 family)